MGRKNRGNLAKGENTIIGEGTVIKGDIVSDSAIIRVDGKVDGAINTKGDLVVATSGVVNGDVTASNLNLAGQIVGDVEVTNKIEVEAKGRLLGNISTKLLAMDETAVIQGNVNMTNGESETKANGKAEESDSKADTKESETKEETNEDKTAGEEEKKEE